MAPALRGNHAVFHRERKKTRIYACFQGIKVPALKCGYWSEAAAAHNTCLKKQERKVSLGDLPFSPAGSTDPAYII